MTDGRNKNTDTGKIYTLLLSLKEEVQRLSLQVKALTAELKGVKNNG